MLVIWIAAAVAAPLAEIDRCMAGDLEACAEAAEAWRAEGSVGAARARAIWSHACEAGHGPSCLRLHEHTRLRRALYPDLLATGCGHGHLESCQAWLDGARHAWRRRASPEYQAALDSACAAGLPRACQEREEAAAQERLVWKEWRGFLDFRPRQGVITSQGATLLFDRSHLRVVDSTGRMAGGGHLFGEPPFDAPGLPQVASVARGSDGRVRGVIDLGDWLPRVTGEHPETLLWTPEETPAFRWVGGEDGWLCPPFATDGDQVVGLFSETRGCDHGRARTIRRIDYTGAVLGQHEAGVLVRAVAVSAGTVAWIDGRHEVWVVRGEGEPVNLQSARHRPGLPPVLTLSRDGDLLLVNGPGGAGWTLWRLDGEEPAELGGGYGRRAVTAAAFREDGGRLALAKGSRILVLETEQGSEVLPPLDGGGAVRWLDYDADMLVAATSQSITLFGFAEDRPQGEPWPLPEPDAHPLRRTAETTRGRGHLMGGVARPGARLHLEPYLDLQVFEGFERRAVASADGTFRFHDVPYGRWRVFSEEDAYEAWAEVNHPGWDQAVPVTSLVHLPVQVLGPDDKPVTEAQVWQWDAFEDRSYDLGLTDAQGIVRTRSDDPSGDLLVAEAPDGSRGAARVTPMGSRSFEIRLLPPGSDDLVELRVEDELGRPLAGARVLTESPGRPWTDEDGRTWALRSGEKTGPVQIRLDEDHTHMATRIELPSRPWSETTLVVPSSTLVLEPAPGLRWVRLIQGTEVRDLPPAEEPVRLSRLPAGPAQVWTVGDNLVGRHEVVLDPAQETRLRPVADQPPGHVRLRLLDVSGAPAAGARAIATLLPGGSQAPQQSATAAPDGSLRLAAAARGQLLALVDPATEMRRMVWVEVPPEGEVDLGELRIDLPRNHGRLWPAIRLGEDGRVDRVEPEGLLAPYLASGDRLIALGGRSTEGMSPEEILGMLWMAEHPLRVRVEDAEGNHRRIWLPSRPRCDEADRCHWRTRQGLEPLP